MTTRQASAHTGISERWLKEYAREKRVLPRTFINKFKKAEYVWSEADCQRAVEIWQDGVETFGIRKPWLSRQLHEARARRLARNGIHSNRIGDASFAA